MSEQGPGQSQGDVVQQDGGQSAFDPLKEATMNADQHRKRYYSMVGDVSEFPDHDTFSAAHKDMADYLSSRPYEDDKGNVHSAENAQFMKKTETEEEYYDRLAMGSVEATDQFAGKTLDELAHMVAEAKARGDTTAAKDAEDVFSDKFVAMAEKYSWPDEAISSRRDRFHEVMNGKEDEAPATQAAAESTPETNTPDEPPVANNETEPDAMAAEEEASGGEAESAPDSDAPVAPEQQDQPEEIAEPSDIPPESVEELMVTAEEIARERRLAERKDALDAVETAFRDNPENISVVEGLKAAQDRYTRLKARSETAGHIGRTKRDEELAEAESALKIAEIMYARAVTEEKSEAGLLESKDPAELRMLRGEQMFGTMRQLINERRTKVKEYRTDKIENANVGMRALGAIGNFFNSGGKWSKRLKAGGIGAGVGAAKTAGVLFSGIGWPITIPLALATGTGVGLGIRGASIVDTLNRQVEDIGAEGKDKAIITDDMFRDLMEQFRASTDSIDAKSSKMSQDFLDAARTQGYENADAARKEGRAAMRRYTVGFGIGAAATSITTLIVHNITAAPAAVGGVLPKTGFPTSQLPEFQPGADDIARGEGWLHQFRDMGMTVKQAHAMFSDSSVMKQLVSAHAAYADNSARIGGFGINLPKSGHLSAKAMEIIGKAMVAKGF